MNTRQRTLKAVAIAIPTLVCVAACEWNSNSMTPNPTNGKWSLSITVENLSQTSAGWNTQDSTARSCAAGSILAGADYDVKVPAERHSVTTGTGEGRQCIDYSYLGSLASVAGFGSLSAEAYSQP